MLKSSLSNHNGISSKINHYQNISTKTSEHPIDNKIDNNNNPEFQKLVNQMILNLVAKTEAELITISTLTQKYKETTAQKVN